MENAKGCWKGLRAGGGGRLEREGRGNVRGAEREILISAGAEISRGKLTLGWGSLGTDGRCLMEGRGAERYSGGEVVAWFSEDGDSVCSCVCGSRARSEESRLWWGMGRNLDEIVVPLSEASS